MHTRMHICTHIHSAGDGSQLWGDELLLEVQTLPGLFYLNAQAANRQRREDGSRSVYLIWALTAPCSPAPLWEAALIWGRSDKRFSWFTFTT
ncbi:unnamed protein product [Tetraodon nigroviridis]|uniref:(spotted green pufferfish) hypothetical protein n=1 Tax=Tetraodon nigroviridis TaxID=99883 RepID=Q4S8C7_TETNG|nr:unnamed protein product [Tetraodon nigroviridis]